MLTKNEAVRLVGKTIVGGDKVVGVDYIPGAARFFLRPKQHAAKVERESNKYSGEAWNHVITFGTARADYALGERELLLVVNR